MSCLALGKNGSRMSCLCLAALLTDDRTAAAHLADIRRVKALAMDKLATLKAPASDVGKQSAENNVEGADKQVSRLHRIPGAELTKR